MACDQSHVPVVQNNIYHQRGMISNTDEVRPSLLNTVTIVLFYPNFEYNYHSYRYYISLQETAELCEATEVTINTR